jgi:hypothetical protein
LAFSLDTALALLVPSLAIIVAVITLVVSFRLIKLFKGSPLEKPWKVLILVPVFMAGVAICELLNINVLRVRATFALLASITFLYCIILFDRSWKSIGKR